MAARIASSPCGLTARRTSVLLGCLSLAACLRTDPPLPPEGLRLNFADEKLSLADHFRGSSEAYRLEEGALKVAGARNHPLWLKRCLPDNVVVRVRVRALSPEIDLKFELAGDGISYARALSYTASGYVVNIGGWRATRDQIARQDEHGLWRAKKRARPWIPGQSYLFELRRREMSLLLSVDGEPYLRFVDWRPLRGARHCHFAFNNWNSAVAFDSLEIEPADRP